jgi:acetyl-CoA decarbonylase/synthase complex subunit gamma
VLSDVGGEGLFTLLLEKAALFSDPETPHMVPSGVYDMGDPSRHAPVLLASSWALTYYNLSLAAEAARTPVFLCFEQISEPDVMCWCRRCHQSTQKGNFDAGATARFIRDCRLEERVDHRILVISERNAPLKGDLEKALPEWDVVVGPDRADRLHGFLRGFAKELAAQCKTA